MSNREGVGGWTVSYRISALHEHMKKCLALQLSKEASRTAAGLSTWVSEVERLPYCQEWRSCLSLQSSVPTQWEPNSHLKDDDLENIQVAHTLRSRNPTWETLWSLRTYISRQVTLTVEERKVTLLAVTQTCRAALLTSHPLHAHSDISNSYRIKSLFVSWPGWCPHVLYSDNLIAKLCRMSLSSNNRKSSKKVTHTRPWFYFYFRQNLFCSKSNFWQQRYRGNVPPHSWNLSNIFW